MYSQCLPNRHTSTFTDKTQLLHEPRVHYLRGTLTIVDMVKTWKNKVKMYKVIGIQCPTPAP